MMQSTMYFMIAKGMSLIYSIMSDEAFNPAHESYQGFLNIGFGGYIPGDDHITWKFICNNPDIFRPAIKKMGLSLEGNILNYEETVFVPSV